MTYVYPLVLNLMLVGLILTLAGILALTVAIVIEYRLRLIAWLAWSGMAVTVAGVLAISYAGLRTEAIRGRKTLSTYTVSTICPRCENAAPFYMLPVFNAPKADGASIDKLQCPRCNWTWYAKRQSLKGKVNDQQTTPTPAQ